MTDKERLEEIKLLVEELTYEYVHDDTFYGLFVDIDRESIDLLIEQAEIGVNAGKDKQTLIKSNIELNARVEELERELEEHKSKFTVKYTMSLRKRNKRYRKALEFYANEETYETKFATDTDEIFDPFTLIELDEGKKARKALEELK